MAWVSYPLPLHHTPFSSLFSFHLSLLSFFFSLLFYFENGVGAWCLVLNLLIMSLVGCALGILSLPLFIIRPALLSFLSSSLPSSSFFLRISNFPYREANLFQNAVIVGETDNIGAFNLEKNAWYGDEEGRNRPVKYFLHQPILVYHSLLSPLLFSLSFLFSSLLFYLLQQLPEGGDKNIPVMTGILVVSISKTS